MVFSGRVVSTAGGPLANATVTVNGKPTHTDTTGFFRFYVPPDKHYVLNARAPGASFLSRVFDRGVTGGIYPLRPATVVTIDPTHDAEVQDKRTSRDCPGPASLSFDAKTFPAGVRPIWQDGKENVVAPGKDPVPSLDKFRPKQAVCGPGARVRIGANSLEDAGGNPPVAPVQVTLSTVDLMSPTRCLATIRSRSCRARRFRQRNRT